MAEKTTEAPPLTVDTVLTAVRGVNWRALGEELFPLEHHRESNQWVYPKLDEIQQRCHTDDERLHRMIERWVQGDGEDKKPSWRRIIYALDGANETRIADHIRHFAEPVPDPTLTVEKVAEVMGEMGDRERVWYVLDVPASKQADIERQSSTEGEKSHAVSQYWVSTRPDASWERLGNVLYVCGEERAVVMAKQYLPKDPTLTTENIIEVVREVEHRWLELGRGLVPESKMGNIKSLYKSDRMRMEAVVDYYMKYYPTPSWKHVAIVLQRMELHKLADEVTTKYVRARSKELFDEAMAHGYVEARDIKALIFGAAGTGKSHTIALIMDEDPPSVRRSTPCATRPVRAVSRTRAEKRGNKFVRVTHDQLAQTIADTSTMLPSKPPSAVNAKTPAGSSSPPTAAGTSKPQPGPPEHTVAQPPSAKDASAITHEKFSGSTVAEDELLRRIEMSPYELHAKKAFTRDRISLIDTGGQPQFHEVLPIFMRGTSATMFAIRLDESLDTHPLIEYFDDNGHRVGVPYRSAHTNKQILRHCMRVMQSQASQSEDGLCPNAIFIGTHKDLEDQCPESREEKNLTIGDMLLPAVHDDAIYCGEELKELIFPLNAKHPGPQEREFAAEIRRVIVERSRVKPKQIPLRWYALELALQKRMLELGRGVLSKAECFAVAQRFHFDEESFEEALKYLDSLNILFYYKDVLPDIIFCDSQVLLDKITELVEHIHRLKTHPSQHRATEGKLSKLRDQGIVTVELLSKPEFSRHYVPGLFGPVQLLKLFTKLLIVSQITEEEYLMPCLLPVTEEPTLLSPSSGVPSLLFHFPHSPLVGVFCGLVAYLLSRAKWKLLFDASSQSPARVDRNTIEFEVPGGLPGRITLTDSFSTYFQVSIQLPAAIASELYPEVCPRIRETIIAGLRSASSTLHYNNSVPQDAFFCTGDHGSTDTPTPHMHVATVEANRRLMTCTVNRAEVCSRLEEQHLIWFPQTSSACESLTEQKHSSPAVRDTIGIFGTPSGVAGYPAPKKLKLDIRDTIDILGGCKPTQKQLLQHLYHTVPDKWRAIGTYLDIPAAQLSVIDELHRSDPRKCLMSLLTERWLPRVSPPPTWQDLAEAVEFVGHPDVAQNLRQKFCST